MNILSMKLGVPFVLFVVIGCLSSLASAIGFDNSPGKLKTIGRIDHNVHVLIIDDQTYKMPLNFKVYVRDRNERLRAVNRYALKVGQSVYINTTQQSRVDYINELLIISD